MQQLPSNKLLRYYIKLSKESETEDLVRSLVSDSVAAAATELETELQACSSGSETVLASNGG